MSLLRLVPFAIFFGKPPSKGLFSSSTLPPIRRNVCLQMVLQSLLVLSAVIQGVSPLSPLTVAPAWAGSAPVLPEAPDQDLPVLTMDQAVHRALDRNPGLARERARVARMEARSVLSGELPDPKLVLGEQYFPINLNMGQSLLAMTTVGLRQSFSPWGKRGLLHEGSVRDRSSSRWDLEDSKIRLVRDVRLTWMDLYLDTRTGVLLRSIGLLWQEAFQAALARYRQGTGSESDLLLAQFQKDTLQDTQETFRIKEEKTLHRLMRLMRTSRSFRISDDKPLLPTPLPESVLLSRIDAHPAFKSRSEEDAAQALRIQAAQKDRIPAISVEGDYSYFMGPSLITATPNLFSVVLTMNLPVRPGERQDQKVREEEKSLESLEARRDGLRQKLAEEIRNAESGYRSLSRRVLFLDRRLLPEARRNAEAALESYATGTVHLGRVLDTMKKVEEVELQALALRVNRMKKKAELDYLEGTLKGGSREP